MSDELWSEFETFEKSCGEVDANSTMYVSAVVVYHYIDVNLLIGFCCFAFAYRSSLPREFHKRHQHARSIFRDRKRLTTNIVFDRLAVPPSVKYTRLTLYTLLYSISYLVLRKPLCFCKIFPTCVTYQFK